MGNNLLPQFLGLPVPVLSANKELGLGVPNNIRDKIAQGQYVDLASMLPSTSCMHDRGRPMVTLEGQLTMAPANNKAIQNIEEWFDAFLTFASIFLSHHPDQTQAILKYLSIICMAAKRHVGLGWLSYNSHFRMRVVDSRAAYNAIDQEFWVLCMSPSAAQTSDKKCYDFNLRTCTRIVAYTVISA